MTAWTDAVITRKSRAVGQMPRAPVTTLEPIDASSSRTTWKATALIIRHSTRLATGFATGLASADTSAANRF